MDILYGNIHVLINTVCLNVRPEDQLINSMMINLKYVLLVTTFDKFQSCLKYN